MIARAALLRALRRAAALGLAAALLAGGYFGLVRPLVQLHRHYDDEIVRAQESLAEHEAAARNRQELQRLLDERKRLDPARRYYLDEPSPALASAALHALVKRAVERGKGELVSIQVVSAQRDASPRTPALREVTLRANLRGDARALQKTLYELEYGLPVVVVSNLSVDASAGELAIRFDASAFTRERRR